MHSYRLNLHLYMFACQIHMWHAFSKGICLQRSHSFCFSKWNKKKWDRIYCYLPLKIKMICYLITLIRLSFSKWVSHAYYSIWWKTIKVPSNHHFITNCVHIYLFLFTVFPCQTITYMTKQPQNNHHHYH